MCDRSKCADCGGAIPAGEAHIRTECFRQVAFCDGCHVKRLVRAGMPEQRGTDRVSS